MSVKQLFAVILLITFFGANVEAKEKYIFEHGFQGLSPKLFAKGCFQCQDEAFRLSKSVGGHCPSDCADVYANEVCDNKGRCKAGP